MPFDRIVQTQDHPTTPGRRLENNIAKASNIVIYSVCRVGMSNLLVEYLLSRTLLFADLQMDKVWLRSTK
jgi:hypothetical protein